MDLDHVNSNFGAAPERWVRNSKLEKVKLINDTVAVMVTSAHCVETFSGQTEKWKAGADTVKRHPIFSADIPVDSMRQILSEQYYFVNNMEEVEFEGFDKKLDGTISKRDKRREARKIRKNEKNGGISLIPPKEIDDLKEDAPRKKNPIRTWIMAVLFSTAAAGSSKIR